MEFEETGSGVRKEGGWEELSSFGEELEQVMKDAGMSRDALEKFRRWRPKKSGGESELSRKTVEQATEKERELGERSDGLGKDVKEASGKAAEAGIEVAHRKNPGEELVEASDGFLRPVYSRAARLVRSLEKRIYSRLMLRFNPYYLDTEELNVDIRSVRDGYSMELTFSDEDMRRRVVESLEGPG